MIRWQDKTLVFVGCLLAACTGQLLESSGGSGSSGAGPGAGAGVGAGAGPGAGGSSGASGSAGVAGIGGTKPLDCAPNGTFAAPAPVRRLTRREYDNSVRDLLGETSSMAENFVADQLIDGFENNAGLPVTTTIASQYAEAASTLASNAVTRGLDRLLPCAVAEGDEACASEFITDFGRRAYRRPLTSTEAARLLTVFRSAVTQGGTFTNAIQAVLEAILQSPNFTHHVEKGEPAQAGQSVVPLTAHEVAARLSYFLWGTIPDAALEALADSGGLRSREQVEAQARLMLADPRAKAGVLGFFRQWLKLDLLSIAVKSAQFPEWNTSIAEQAREETETFVENVLFGGDGNLDTLLTASYSYMRPELAAIYGATPNASGLGRVELDEHRAGLLTHVSVLAINAHSDQTSPVHRGLFVRERLLCQTMPSPPPTLNVTAPEADPTLTTRQRYAQHSSDPYCANCHKLMDPIGLGFEHYDPIGRYRESENGLPIDARGEIVESQDANGAFDGAIELSQKLAASQQVETCLAEQWLNFGTGVRDRENHGCAALGLGERLRASGGNVPDLIIGVTTSDAFRHRRAYTLESCQ